jgi:hypothetical protein
MGLNVNDARHDHAVSGVDHPGARPRQGHHLGHVADGRDLAVSDGERLGHRTGNIHRVDRTTDDEVGIVGKRLMHLASPFSVEDFTRR